MTLRLLALLCMLLATACGSAETATPREVTSEPTHAASGSATSRPATDAPTTDEPAPDPSATDAAPEPTAPSAPLPEPALTTAEEIVAVLYERAQAEQAVVSMLDLLGIGLYETDGTVIRAGTERSDADFFVYEPEARGLAELLKAHSDQQRWVPFAEFHVALANLGFQGSAADLSTAYSEAYESDFEAPVSQLVFGLGGVVPDAQLHPLLPWLLVLDGFVPPHDSQAVALAGAQPMVASSHRGWGLARDRVQALSPTPLEADPMVIAHLMSVVHSASLAVAATPARAHEGHGAPGTPVTISATVQAVASTFVSPFSGRPLIPINPGGGVGAGLPVTWQPEPALDRHGSAPMPAASVTDPLGRSSLTFTPRQEEANGEGQLTREFATLQASVPAAQLVTQLYGLPSLGALVGGEVRGVGSLEIEWHAAEAMRISLINDYDVTLDLILGTTHAQGRDSFEGILALQEDGTWRGTVNGRASGSHTNTALGETCSATWSATQLVEVIGAPAPTALDGDFYFRFFPVSQPSGSMGAGKCPPGVNSYEGIDYAPYNYFPISAAAEGQGLVIVLPQEPGGTRDYPVNTAEVKANWRVTIEFLEPPS